MLQLLYAELVDMYCERYYSNTIYSGYGTTIDQLIEDMQISNKLLRKVDWLAYNKAGEIMKQRE